MEIEDGGRSFLVWLPSEKLAIEDLNSCQNPTMRPDLCPHILLPLDEQACGAINQTQHGRHILLSPGSGSDPSSIPRRRRPPRCILPLEVPCRNAK